MASSMLSGERRYVSARRGGMTVLGKIAVPKPVNLPSQKSENHGNDPSVEIVPKGNLSWGSRQCSASNAWGSSALSPSNTGGSAGSLGLSSRPSSGGTGTRPSTGGSEISHDPTSSARGSSSRPSSASGGFTSSLTSSARRPLSAETRPGSSQLSRFAEPVCETSVAWGASGNSQILAHSYSKDNGFSLSSGDFPTLGSEKCTDSHEQEDCNSQKRPVSASGVTTAKEKLEILHTDDNFVDANRRMGAMNSWKRDGGSSPYDCVAVPVNTEKWQMGTHPYTNPNIHPQHFDSWHGPHGAPGRPPPDGRWYGPLGGPPGPGNYPVPVGAFAYYQPHLPVRPLPNSQAVLRPGSSPGGYHPRNGESYRPHVPESFALPVMPVRGAVHPGSLPYDGYFHPLHAPYSSRERDAPLMGVATGPCVYGGYPVRNVCPDTVNFDVRPGEYGPRNPTMVKEHVDDGHLQGSQQGEVVKEHLETRQPQESERGPPFKVLLKQHDARKGSDGKEKNMEPEYAGTASTRPLVGGKNPATPCTQPVETGNRPGTPMKEDASGVRRRIAESENFSKTFPAEVSSQSAHSQGSSHSAPTSSNLPVRTEKVGDGLMEKPETSSTTREVLYSSNKKNHSPIDRGSHSRARISEDRFEVAHVPAEEVRAKPSRANVKVEHSATSGVVTPENMAINTMLPPSKDVVSAKDKRLEPTIIRGTVVSRPVSGSAGAVSNSSGDGLMAQSHIQRRAQGVQSRREYRGKGKFGMQDSDEWRQKSHVPYATQEETEKSGPNLHGQQGGDSHDNSYVDPIEAQRTKMREIAIQRAKQLQKEEEERIREQKAKALAKLEELNRRVPTEILNDKSDRPLPTSGSVERKQESDAGRSPDHRNTDRLPSPAVCLKSDSVTGKNKAASRVSGSNACLKTPLKTSVRPPLDTDVTKILPSLSPPPLEVQTTYSASQVAAPPVHDTFATKHKHMGYKRKQNMPLDKNSNDKLIPTGNHGGIEIHGSVVGDASGSSGGSSLPTNTTAAVEPLHQKKKNGRSVKNKYKMDEVSTSAPSLPALVPYEGPTEASANMSGPVVQVQIAEENSDNRDAENMVPSTEQGLSLPSEEAHGRGNNHWKPQPRGRGNTHGTRSTDKSHNNDSVVWAPVASLNKNGASDDHDNGKIEVQTPGPIETGVQNRQRSRRAEMERYVPKPVAEALPQEGTTQRPLSPSVNETVSNHNNNTGKAEPLSLPTNSNRPDSSKAGFAVAKNGENKNSNHGKRQGLWRERGLTESLVVHTSQEGSSLSSDHSKIVQKTIERRQPSKPETGSKVHAYEFDNWSTPTNPISSEPVTALAGGKYQRVTNRGKRQQFKGDKVTPHSYASDPKDMPGENTDKAAHRLGPSDIKPIFVECHDTREQTPSSHWQPKSPASSVNNIHGQEHKAHGAQRVTNQTGKAAENEVPAQRGGRNQTSRNIKGNCGAALGQPQSDNSNSVKPSGQREEANKDSKHINLANVASRSQSQDKTSSAIAAVPGNIYNQNEQSFSSGPQKQHGHNNGRFGRGGHEGSQGGRSSAVQGGNAKQQHHNGRRNNSHYEYQQTSSNFNEPNESFEGGSSRYKGSRYHDRGGGAQTHSRRGGSNFYGRNSGGVEVGASSGGNGDWSS